MSNLQNNPKSTYCRHSLDHLKEALNILGNPQNHIAPVIHVTGTNGKFSTISFLRYILNESGYVVNTFTSPHLLSVTERFMIGNRLVKEEELTDTLDYITAKIGHLPELNFFDKFTIAAFIIFSKPLYKADFTLLEVGIGGEFDSTNVISSKLLAIITSIGYDHMNILGPDLLSIANSKSGIITSATQAAIAACFNNNEVQNIIRMYAHNAGTILYEEEKSFHMIINKNNQASFYNTNNVIENFNFPHVGSFQIHNCALAIQAALYIKNSGYDNISNANIISGINKTKIPARMQYIISGQLYEKYLSNFTVLLDGAHNEPGLQQLFNHINDNNYTYKIGIAGFSRDINNLPLQLFETFDHLIICNITSDDYTYLPKKSMQPPEKIHILLQNACPQLQIIKCNTIKEGVLQAATYNKMIPKEEQLLVIFGSLYLAANFLSINS